jgi:NADP-dependent 3-hydroxy acid dehydrogenase YdfG
MLEKKVFGVVSREERDDTPMNETPCFSKTEKYAKRRRSMADAQVILITGAGFGIGQATAELLSSQGYHVFGTSRDPKRHGRRAYPLLEMDVHSDESVSSCVEHIMAQAGSIDALINNAGTGIAGAAEETQLAEARMVFETNFFGTIRVTNAVLPTMRKRRSGKIPRVPAL